MFYFYIFSIGGGSESTGDLVLVSPMLMPDHRGSLCFPIGLCSADGSAEHGQATESTRYLVQWGEMDEADVYGELDWSRWLPWLMRVSWTPANDIKASDLPFMLL